MHRAKIASQLVRKKRGSAWAALAFWSIRARVSRLKSAVACPASEGRVAGCPDECEDDCNANGIPDECEAQQSQSGGGSSPTSTATASTLSESEAEQAYTEFLIWSLAQEWGPNAPRTRSQQFQAMVDKMRDLGLPLRKP